MTLDEIETAIGQRLEGMTDCPPIAWPNRDFVPTGVPYIEFRHAPTEVRDEVIGGGYPYQIGLFLMTVVVPSGGFSVTANGFAQDIADRFPKALRMAVGGGNVVINAPPSFGSAFQDGAYWRTPVRVSYITEGDTNEFADPTDGADVSATTDGIERVGNTLRVDIDSLPTAPGA